MAPVRLPFYPREEVRNSLTPADSDVTDPDGYALPASSTDGWCTEDTESCYNTENVLDSGDQSYGTYYSWAAATAGTGTASISTDGANAPSSICPKGWRLPTGGPGGEFETLYNDYHSYNAIIDASGPAFVLSGVRDGSSTGNQRSNGYYWSSTAYSSGRAYYLLLVGIGKPSVRPQSNHYKRKGYSVRCIWG